MRDGADGAGGHVPITRREWDQHMSSVIARLCPQLMAVNRFRPGPAGRRVAVVFAAIVWLVPVP
jgi:hypothetical protein